MLSDNVWFWLLTLQELKFGIPRNHPNWRPYLGGGKPSFLRVMFPSIYPRTQPMRLFEHRLHPKNIPSHVMVYHGLSWSIIINMYIYISHIFPMKLAISHRSTSPVTHTSSPGPGVNREPLDWKADPVPTARGPRVRRCRGCRGWDRNWGFSQFSQQEGVN